MSLLKADNIVKSFPIESGFFKTKKGLLRALNNVSVSVSEGKVLAIVGESGSGKTTLGKILCRLLTRDSGTVEIDGKDIDSYSRYALANKIQMIFQDPFSSLNPKLTIGTTLGEASILKAGPERDNAVKETLSTVGLNEDILFAYPHQFSGGQRQRIALARCLLRNPKIIIADEPLSSLDISIQNQLLNLFAELKETKLVSFLFISHDIVTASNLADYLIVMKDGRIIEQGDTKDVILSPKDPYTIRLLEATPRIIQK